VARERKTTSKAIIQFSVASRGLKKKLLTAFEEKMERTRNANEGRLSPLLNNETILAKVITLYFLYVCRTTKAYEWGVEAMKLASKLKLDQQPCPPSVASHLLHQVDAFLSAADKVSHPTALEDLNTLARKLDNPKLLDQCKVTRSMKQNVSVLLVFCPFRNFSLSPRAR
jgi:hypothetical protein